MCRRLTLAMQIRVIEHSHSLRICLKFFPERLHGHSVTWCKVPRAKVRYLQQTGNLLFRTVYKGLSLLLIILLLFAFALFWFLGFTVYTIDLFLLVFLRLVLVRLLASILSLFLHLPVLDLVLDEVMERCDRTDKGAEIDGHELIISLHAHCSCKFAVVPTDRLRFDTIDLCPRRGFWGGEVR